MCDTQEYFFFCLLMSPLGGKCSSFMEFQTWLRRKSHLPEDFSKFCLCKHWEFSVRIVTDFKYHLYVINCTFLPPAQTSSLNFRCTYPKAYSTCSFGFPMNISNSWLYSWSCPFPSCFTHHLTISINGKSILLIRSNPWNYLNSPLYVIFYIQFTSTSFWLNFQYTSRINHFSTSTWHLIQPPMLYFSPQ